jgi:hypothetical protein
MISFRRFVFSSEMSFFAAIIALFFFFWSWAPFLRLFLKAFLSFSECRINFPIYFVWVSPRLSLEMGIFVVSLVLLDSFFKIVVEACGCRD